MSSYDKIAALFVIRRAGLRLIPAFACAAILSACNVAVAAGDVPYVDKALAAGDHAGGMTPASIWALVAIAMFACVVLLGWGAFTIGTKIQTSLATLEAQNTAMKEQVSALATMRGQCTAGDAMHGLLNAARTELEKTGRLIRGEPL